MSDPSIEKYEWVGRVGMNMLHPEALISRINQANDELHDRARRDGFLVLGPARLQLHDSADPLPPVGPLFKANDDRFELRCTIRVIKL